MSNIRESGREYDFVLNLCLSLKEIKIENEIKMEEIFKENVLEKIDI